MKTFVALLMLFFFNDNINYSNIHWLGHASFWIQDNSINIFIDPYNLKNDYPKADYIFITHSHKDHFSQKDIDKIKQQSTIYIAPSGVAEKLSDSAIIVVPDSIYSIKNLKIQTVPAYNSIKKNHPKDNLWVGYVITLSNGLKIYHAGDTEYFYDMKNIKTDIALLPCDGKYTMDIEETAKSANIINAKILFPMHRGANNTTENMELIKKLFKGKTVFFDEE